MAYSINYPFSQGCFDRVQFEKCGLIRLEGWFSGCDLRQFERPKCFIAGREIPVFQIFRTYRPDVATALSSSNFYHGLVITYRVFVDLASQPTQLSFNGKTIFYKFDRYIVDEPAYAHLLDSEEVLHRKHIYGFGPPSSAVIDEIFELARRLPSPILDFGCGSGALVKRLREVGIEAYGIELEREPIIQSLLPEVKDFIDLYQGGFPLPYKTGEFQSVFATEVIEHIEDYEAAIREITRITSSHFTMTVPDSSSIPVCHHNNVVPWHLLESTHVNFFTQKSLKRVLGRNFSEVDVARICPVTINDSVWFGSLVGICHGPIGQDSKL